MKELEQWKIFETYRNGEPVPEGFNAVTVTLDAQMNSALEWKDAIDSARQYISEGKHILWKMDFGLFERLVFPMENETQFLSLALAVEHFIKNVWEPFSEHMVGISIYQGSVDFSADFHWTEEQNNNFQEWLKNHVQDSGEMKQELGLDDEQIVPGMLMRTENGLQLLRLYCRDVCSDYLILLRERFPDESRVMCLVDVGMVKELSHLVHLINPERFDRIQLVMKGSHLPIQGFGWSNIAGDKGYISRRPLTIPESHVFKIGICLPSGKVCNTSQYQQLDHALSALYEKGVAFKLIPEEYLTYEWDELEFMLAQSELVSTGGKRKLLGFCAAGGQVLTLGELQLGLPHEAVFSIQKIG